MSLASTGIAIQDKIPSVFNEVKCLESRERLSCIGRKSIGVDLVEIAQLWEPGVFDAVAPLVLGTVFFFAPQQLCGELPHAPLFVSALLYQQVYIASYKW